MFAAIRTDADLVEAAKKSCFESLAVGGSGLTKSVDLPLLREVGSLKITGTVPGFSAPALTTALSVSISVTTGLARLDLKSVRIVDAVSITGNRDLAEVLMGGVTGGAVQIDSNPLMAAVEFGRSTLHSLSISANAVLKTLAQVACGSTLNSVRLTNPLISKAEHDAKVACMNLPPPPIDDLR